MMSNLENDVAQNSSKQRLAAEVLELGQSLFETAFEAGGHQLSTGEEGETYPLEELQAAAQEFFPLCAYC